jgi:hypothetical protein
MTSFGELQGGLGGLVGGRVNVTERERGQQREPAEPAVSVARIAEARGIASLLVAVVEDGLAVGVPAWAVKAPERRYKTVPYSRYTSYPPERSMVLSSASGDARRSHSPKSGSTMYQAPSR